MFIPAWKLSIQSKNNIHTGLHTCINQSIGRACMRTTRKVLACSIGHDRLFLSEHSDWSRTTALNGMASIHDEVLALRATETHLKHITQYESCRCREVILGIWSLSWTQCLVATHAFHFEGETPWRPKWIKRLCCGCCLLKRCSAFCVTSLSRRCLCVAVWARNIENLWTSFDLCRRQRRNLGANLRCPAVLVTCSVRVQYAIWMVEWLPAKYWLTGVQSTLRILHLENDIYCTPNNFVFDPLF